MQQAARERRADHDARRERHRHRRARRRRRWPVARPTRSTTASPGRGRPRRRPPTARSCWPASPARPLYIVHMSAKQARRPRSPRRATRAATSSARRARSTSTSRSRSSSAHPGFEGAKWVCSHPAARPAPRATRTTCGRRLRTNDLQRGLHRPLPVLHEGPEGARRRRLLARSRTASGRVEHRMDLLYQGVVTGEITLERWVELCSTTPARMFGLYGRKGVIAAGRRRRHRRLRPAGPHEHRARARPTT